MKPASNPAQENELNSSSIPRKSGYPSKLRKQRTKLLARARMRLRR